MSRPLSRRIRWLMLTLLAVAAAAGCATPDQSDAPNDSLEDGDLDGVPDGKSPVPENVDDETNDSTVADNETPADANATG